jgi:hypothetical protein
MNCFWSANCTAVCRNAALILVICTSAASAGNKYKCTITHIADQQFPIQKSDIGQTIEPYISNGSTPFPWNWLVTNGQLELDSVARLWVGKVFWVDDSTGVVSGDIDSQSFSSANIASLGNAEWSFKAIYEGHSSQDGHRHVMYLEINDYALSQEKPFLGTGMTVGSATVLGTCIVLR